MKKQELLKKLIAHYKKTIKLIKDETDLRKVMNILDKRSVDLGVCWCAIDKFKLSPSDLHWADKYGLAKHRNHWAQRPFRADNIPEAISLLQIRIDIMKKEILIEDEN